MTDGPKRNHWKRSALIALIVALVGGLLWLAFFVLYVVLVTRISYVG